MYNITLIGTRHGENGECNSNALYQIIENINPEIIFEEIPLSIFDKYYIDKSRSNLETDTINRYLGTHKAEHIPVDSDNVPPDSFFKDYEAVHKRIEGSTSINGFNYRTFVDRCRLHTAMYGFEYLNSAHCIYHHEEIDGAIEKGLQELNNDKLSQTYALWKDINENRENEMLRNIYTYSKDHRYNQALFLIGAAHRKSIMQKIQEYQNKEAVKLNWSFYNGTMPIG